ncbi:MAG: hypothetical protein U9P70_02115 [Patescibacteria group bacterium]|nr:hypothetical protein [Patescibacteria group bacterium]
MSKTTIKNFGFRRNRIKKVTVSQKIKNGKKILGIFFVVVIGLMSLSYIYQMSSVATNGYEIEKYEDKLTELKKENQIIMIKLADLKAMHNFESNDSELVAIKYDNISYVTSSLGAVAIQK